MLRDLHEATRSFRPPADAAWFRWHGRDLGGPARVIGHCDLAPWNIVARAGMPVAFIDWEFAGPVDPLVELAQLCWLNAKLHEDIVAERDGLPPLADRLRQLVAIVDAYGMAASQRRGFFDRIVEFVVSETAWEADDAGVSPDMTSHPMALWAMAWRARAAAWLLRHRPAFEAALTQR
jgi:aminoglycoside phosphotransferase (APT) family kinase protein